MTVTPSATAPVENLLDDRLIERCEEIPEDPVAADYVVFDVLHFSNTVIELLANGAEYVHITDERGQELAYRESNPRAVIGGESTADLEPVEGYDFFNSPSYVQQVDVAGRPVSMTSSNGGRAVARLRAVANEGTAVYVGSTMNARALAAHLRTRDRPTRLVSAGSRGAIAIEDHIGATLVSRYLDGFAPSKTEQALFRHDVEWAKGPDYLERDGLRCRDVREFAMNFDSRQIVPKLVGDSLVDLARADPTVRSGKASD